MQPNEQAEFFRAVGAFVVEQVKAVTTPLLTHVVKLETEIKILRQDQRRLEAGDDFREMIQQNEAKAFPHIAVMIEDAVSKIPKAKDGTSVTIEDVMPQVQKYIHTQVEQIRNENKEYYATLPQPKDGVPGKDADEERMMTQILDFIPRFISDEISKLPVPKDGAPGKDGQSVDILDVVKELDAQGIIERVVASVPLAKDGAPGKDAVIDYAMITGQITSLVEGEVAKIQKPKDGEPGLAGKDVDIEVVAELIGRSVEAGMKALPVPRDGKDGTSVVIDDVMPEIREFLEGSIGQIKREIESWPRPEDGAPGKDGENGTHGTNGKSVSIDELAPVVQSVVAKAVAELPVPRSVLSCHISRDGHLHAVLTDGTSIDLGEVVGKDGVPGLPGKDGEPGTHGKNGTDGLGFKDMSVTFDGERDFIFKFVLDERVEELAVTIPFVIYRGVWKAGPYRRGDSVTRDGCQWIAQKDTEAQPGTVDSGWQLAVKKGRDGRDGSNGGPGPQGPAGKNGKDGSDLTQIGPDGKKWGV